MPRGVVRQCSVRNVLIVLTGCTCVLSASVRQDHPSLVKWALLQPFATKVCALYNKRLASRISISPIYMMETVEVMRYLRHLSVFVLLYLNQSLKLWLSVILYLRVSFILSFSVSIRCLSLSLSLSLGLSSSVSLSQNIFLYLSICMYL